MNELLELLAQLAVTIAALSAVAGAAQGNVTNYLLRDVAMIGLTVVLYSVLPLLMLAAMLEESFTLRVCSALAGLSWLSGYGLYIKRIWGQQGHFVGAFYLGLVVTIAGLTSFTIGVVEPGSVAYLSGLVCMLTIASLNFVTGVFGNESGES